MTVKFARRLRQSQHDRRVTFSIRKLTPGAYGNAWGLEMRAYRFGRPWRFDGLIAEAWGGPDREIYVGDFFDRRVVECLRMLPDGPLPPWLDGRKLLCSSSERELPR